MKRYYLVFLTPVLLMIALQAFSPTVAFTQNENLSPSLRSLVEAERAFARTSVQKGVRDSFFEFFAEDGINFTPHPTNTRDAIRKSQPPATRPPITLNWEPAFADISQAGDLGYTTGPFWITDQSAEKRPTRHGFYFSIWKKQADGQWKVVIDAGIQMPAPASNQPPGFHAASASQFKQKSAKLNVEAERTALANLEREFLQAAKAEGVAKAFESFMADEARLHRTGMFPLTEKDAIRAFFAAKPLTMTWETVKADVSQSNDLGYTYGSYELKENSTAATTTGAASVEKGYFVRVWKRNKDGKWKVVLDTTNPLPQEQK
ncbi:MAG TPA: nuclear transport factor 2 family protein [Pyrinomonadaceae bacterium]|jgi:ketosteroid isomerase-like protein|nr:nuclear transport factor 2 family protein [Pyrinomonadaceae bacterium]